jgi:hypothetical protein
MMRLSVSTTCDHGRVSSLALLSPGILEGGVRGGSANITTIIRGDDDMDDENIRNWDSSIDLRYDLPRGRGAFDEAERVTREERDKARRRREKATARHPMDAFKEEVQKRSGGIGEIKCENRVRIPGMEEERRSGEECCS